MNVHGEMVNITTRPTYVSLVRTSAATILADYARLIQLLELPAGDAEALLFRIAIDRRYPFPGSSVPPWQLDGVARAMGKRQHRCQFYMLSNPDHHDWHGHAALARAFGIAHAHPKDTPLSGLVVLLAPLRRIPRGAAGITQRLLPPNLGAQHATLAILDATTIGNGPEGSASTPEVGNMLLASASPGALDRIAGQLLGTMPAPIPNDTTPAYELRGDTDLINQRWPPMQLSLSARWHQMRESWQPEYARWSSRDQRTYTSWLHDTEWGRLFSSYRQRESMRSDEG